MKLTELCEPLFQYVCRLNRSARIGTRHQLAQVRSEIKSLFTEMADKSLSTPGLSDQFGKIRPSMIYFVDWMMRNGKLAFAANWNNLAEEERPPVFVGDEEYFTELRASLEEFDRIPHSQKEARETAAERLMIFHTGLGFGFQGAMEETPVELDSLRRELATRLGVWGDREESDQLCKQTYDHTDETPLDLQPLPTIVPMVVGLVGVVLILLVAATYLFYNASGKLKDNLKTIQTNAQNAMDSASGKPADTTGR